MDEHREFVDFKAIRARVSIGSLLETYRVQLKRVNQSSLKGDCPLPTHSSKGRNTFYVNEAKSVWCCHSDSCKKNGNRNGGNVIDFVASMDDVSPYDAAKKLNSLFPEPVANYTSLPRPSGRLPTSDSKINKPLPFALKDIAHDHLLIREHGISVETARTFGIGFFPGKGTMADRIVFPLEENGALVGYAGRTTLPVTDENPKWLLGKGLKKTFLYNLHRCDPRKPLILVESLWGPPFFSQKGLQAAALMGSNLTQEQERWLDPFLLIVLALDNDRVGIEKSAAIRARLKVKHKVMTARLVE